MLKYAVSALLLFAHPVLAQESADSGATAQRPPAPATDPEASRVRCRSIYQLNSRIPERVCRTRAQWDEIEKQSREALERNRRGAGASGDAGG